MFNNGNTYAKWADDIREAQREDGCIPDICPAYYNYYTSEMTWSSTFPVICDMVYEQFGNIEPIRKIMPLSRNGCTIYAVSSLQRME